MSFSGARLKHLRFREGESLQRLADSVNASKAHIWELETGKSGNPSIELLLRLAQHFSVGIAYFVGEDPDAPEENEQLVAMFRGLKALDRSDREVINALMQLMCERKKKNRSMAD